MNFFANAEWDRKGFMRLRFVFDKRNNCGTNVVALYSTVFFGRKSDGISIEHEDSNGEFALFGSKEGVVQNPK